MTITDPTLLVDKQKVFANIRRMHQKAENNNLVLKPHFKTHQSIAIGLWFKEFGVEQITVSSVPMAEYFAEAGWTNITIAFPCNVRAAGRIDKLAGSVDLSILISDAAAVDLMADAISHNLNVYVEIDTGSGRTGFPASGINTIETVVADIARSKKLRFRGFYSHPGHSYRCRSQEEIRKVHIDAVGKMQQLGVHFASDFPDALTCIGDTPCCSVGEEFTGIDEISPGNFVFYDLMQTEIGSCRWSDIAVALACAVVAKYPDRQELVVHGGAVHLSKDSITKDENTFFGRLALFNDDLTWNEPLENCFLESISQEHGIVKCSDSFFDEVSIGDVIPILPVHSCLTADAMGGYLSTGEQRKIDHMKGA